MTGMELGLGLDLEVDSRDRLTSLGAVFGTTELRKDTSGNPKSALGELDELATKAAFVFGHNILWHDLPWLAKHSSGLGLHRKPAVDTLVLSAIAFAEYPYHALLKDYKLTRDALNDPVADSRIARHLLVDSQRKLREIGANQPVFLRVVRTLGSTGLSTISPEAATGFAVALEGICGSSKDLDTDFAEALGDRTCRTALEQLRPMAAQPADVQLALLFATAWLRVAGTTEATSKSVVMPWVRKQVPLVTKIIAQLRDRPCAAAHCTWCRSVHDPIGQLGRWFQYPDFRAEPKLADGRSAQRAIVDAGFADRPHLALLPTGGGKSLCFQLPAISRYLRRGCLTIVISPLQSLMHDQVDNFVKKTSTDCAVALTGRLTPPERREALDAIRTGAAGILYVSPEQLRNSTFKKAIALREIGAWVFDEAHCLSKWGHDFRPDYLYAARFIKEFSQQQGTPTAPVTCVTATAKPEVRDEILKHFHDELQQELQTFDGHAPRQNLTLRVESLPTSGKAARMCELVAELIGQSPTGSVLVYTATRSNAEHTAKLLTGAGIDAEPFHAGLEVPVKKSVQDRFLSGERRVVCATNAFGMGIDKPDIRLVVHFEIPGSIENYVQEVGRAGRDGLPAEAVLLFAQDDIETQFRLAANSRLDLRDLKGILRRIRYLARPKDGAEEQQTICTTGEILRDDLLAESISPSDRGSSTRVVTAIAWLERGKFLRRDENATTVFQGRPLVKTLDEGKKRIASLDLPAKKAEAWVAILAQLMNAEIDDGLSSDDLLLLPEVLGVVGTTNSAVAGRSILRILVDMQKARLLSSGMRMTAFVRHATTDPSTARLHSAIQLEQRIFEVLRENLPDPEDGHTYPLSLPSLNQELLQRDPSASLDRLRILLLSMTDRASHAGHRAPGLRLSLTSHDHCSLAIRGTWEQVSETSQRRHSLASVCLRVLLEQLKDAKARGASLLVEFTLEQLVAALEQDLELRNHPSPDPATEIEYALLFLHRIGAIVLHKGLAVFRQAMVLRVPAQSQKRQYTKEDFGQLAEHQDERTVQIHAMHEFARCMTSDQQSGLQLLDDYFRLPRDQFLARHFKNRGDEIERATSQESWQRIVLALSKNQGEIVEASGDKSVLVLAGPGSGKTRVVVHRCAYLLRVLRVPAQSILVMCFNRSAALELRNRLRELVGEDARGILVQTYHGMAARLAGRSPAELLDRQQPLATERGQDGSVFDDLMRDAVEQIEAGNRSSEEAEGDDLRERLLTGFRHILVDEYQDIDSMQYRLVSAIAGRTLQDKERKLTVLAVGDDDQNIYQWRGSNVEFLRRFETDYQAKRLPLVENYRSTAHIIATANQLIAQNHDRMKVDAPIRIDTRRAKEALGGRFAGLDPAVRGRVQVLELTNGNDQPAAVLAELQRLKALAPQIAWEQFAVLSPRHAMLDPVRTRLEQAGIPVRIRVDQKQAFSLFRLREVQAFLAAVEGRREPELDGTQLRQILVDLRSLRPLERSFDLVEQTLTAFLENCGEHRQQKLLLGEFFGELLMEQRRERTLGEGVLLGTVHGSKGAEYDHVILLDGDWRPRKDGSWEEQRRLYYVGMTRARQTLTLVQGDSDGAPWVRSLHGDSIHRTSVRPMPVPEGSATMHYELLSQGDIFLAFAGRSRDHETVNAAIQNLATGDALQLVPTERGVFLQDASGVQLGALSKAAAPGWRELLPRVRSVRVAAVLIRRRADEGPDYQDRLRRDAWQVVIPEITYQVL
jgi:ATP-dependent DNA helicase RecQ